MSLRIAMLGWACLSLQEREGTGYNLHASELASALAARGHAVTYLRSGIDYSLRPGMQVRPRERWRGVDCHDLVNSPNLAIGMFNFRNVAAQVSSPEQSAFIVEWLRGQRAQVVHVHSLEGFGFDLIGAIRAAGLPVVVTPHNYFALCPQVDLLYREVAVCDDYEGGERCLHCLSTPDPAREIWSRRWSQSTPGLVRDGIGRALHRGVVGIANRSESLAMGDDLQDASVDIVMPEPAACHTANPARLNQRVLEGDRHLRVLNNYGHRRAAGSAALSAACAVLCPSKFLLGVHAAMGVARGVLRHVPLGQPHFDAIAEASRQSAFDSRVPWTATDSSRPLRFGFFGSTRYNKGLGVLTSAILALDPPTRARCHFHIRASGDVSAHRAALSAVPQASFCGGYTPWDLPSALGDFDVGIVPTTGLENSPFVVLEHLHGGKFTVASELGGPTDFIKPGINGLFAPAGDPAALAEVIRGLVRGDVSIPSPRDVREASALRCFGNYVDEVVGILGEACG